MHKIKSLDGLSGIAELIVVLYNMGAFFGTLFSPNGLYTQVRLGWQIYRRELNGSFSVAVFFVLSGYLLSIKYSKSLREHDLRAGTIKRYFRLTPIIIASTLLAVSLQSIIGFHNIAAARIIGGHQWLASQYPVHLTGLGTLKSRLIGVYQGNVQYNGPLWTILLELFGSFFLIGFVSLFYRSNFFLFNALAIVTTIRVSAVIAFILKERVEKWAQGLANFVASHTLRRDFTEASAIGLSSKTLRTTGYQLCSTKDWIDHKGLRLAQFNLYL